MDPFLLLAVQDQAGRLEQEEVFRDGRGAQAEHGDDLADAQLAPLQKLEDAHPGRVRDRLHHDLVAPEAHVVSFMLTIGESKIL